MVYVHSGSRTYVLVWWEYVSPCAHKEARRTSGVLLSHPLPYSLETGSLTVGRQPARPSKPLCVPQSTGVIYGHMCGHS